MRREKLTFLVSKFATAVRLMGVALLLLVMLSTTAQAQFTTTVSNGQVTITGYTGSGTFLRIPSRINGLPVVSIGDNVFSDSNLHIVIIPSSVTSIGDSAFEFCAGLTSVTIGSGVASIGDSAFEGCTSLINVMIPNGVTNIGGSAFYNCTSLSTVIIPDSVTSIGDSAFEFSGLASVTIGRGLTSIGNEMFFACGHLTSVIIPDNVTSIGDVVFEGCPLTSLIIGQGVTSIGSDAFYGCEMTSVTIPNSVTSIGAGAFISCENLTHVSIGNGVTSIGRSAFSYTGMQSVTIPSSVTSIADYAFAYNDLTSAVFLGNAPTMGFGVFDYLGPVFNVYYYHGAIGFTSPTWTDSSGDTYSAINLGTLIPSEISSATTASGTYGNAFSGYTIMASGSPIIFDAIGLPLGLSINTATGVISGTPTQVGIFNVDLSAMTLRAGTATATLLLTVAKAPVAVTLGDLNFGYTGLPHATTVTTNPTGFPVTLTYDGSTTAPTDAGSYAVVATVNDVNHAGSAQGTLVIAPVLPQVATSSATAISAAGGTLNGTVNPKGAATTVSFQYYPNGTAGGYTNATQTATQSVAVGTANVSFATPITGLSSATLYHYRTVAANTGNSALTTVGADKTFTTLAAPIFGSNPAAYQGGSGAEVSLSVNPNGVATSVYFQYSTVADFSSFLQTAPQSVGSGKVPVNVFALLPGLAAGTTYYYRMVTTGPAGSSTSTPAGSFTTLGFETRLVVQKGDVAGGAATSFASFGNPAVNVDDTVAFAGMLTLATGITAANDAGIWTIDAANTQHLIAQTGGGMIAPGTAGNFATLDDPVFNNNGAVAFRGTLKVVTGQATLGTAAGIWKGDSAADLALVAREGSVAPETNGGTFEAFTSLGLSDAGGAIIYATLNNNTAAGVTAANNIGIWEGNTTGDLHLLLRLGDTVGGKTITKLTFLPGETYVNGQTRSFNSTSGDIFCGVTFSDNTTGMIGVIGGVPQIGLQSGGPAAGVFGTTYASFGNPAINTSDRIAFAATLATGTGGVTTSNNAGIWGLNASMGLLVARSGTELAPGTTATFATFSDPIYNNNYGVAFRATLNVATGQATPTTATGVWCTSANTGPLALVAQQGVTQAPGCPVGATFSAFTELALADQGGAGNQGGVIMLATLNANAAANVGATNNLGIWAVDTTGALQLIVRTGDILNVNGSDKTVTALSFLPALGTVNGQSRSFAQGNGDLVYLATFSDNSTAIFNVVFP